MALTMNPLVLFWDKAVVALTTSSQNQNFVHLSSCKSVYCRSQTDWAFHFVLKEFLHG